MNSITSFFADSFIDDHTPAGARRGIINLQEKVGAQLLRYIQEHGPGHVGIEKIIVPNSSTDMPYVALEVSITQVR